MAEDTSVNESPRGTSTKETPTEPEYKECEGIILAYFPETNKVKVDVGQDKPMATWVSGWFSSFMGLNTNYKPEVGSRVRVVYDHRQNNYYVISCVPSGFAGDKAFRSKTEGTTDVKVEDMFTPTTQTLDESDNSLNRNTVQGELDLENMYGVALQILRFMSRLKASDRAAIECHVLDDFVRVVSENFQHISSFGDFRIYNDGGRLNVRWDGTHREHEALNLQDPTGQALGTMRGKNHVDVDSVEGFESIGRNRFSLWMGHLGNFIHVFLTDPVEGMAGITESLQANRTGRFKAHVNLDGSLLVQSVGDIVFEKVVRIPVPMERHRPEDPEGDQPDGVESPGLNGSGPDPLANWVPEDSDNLWKDAYKLREYARWFSQWYSMAEFRKQPKDWAVASEVVTPAPDKDLGDKAKARRNSGYTEELHTEYVDRYATIRIFRDGSVLTMDAYGDSVHMGGGVVNVSAVRALNLGSAGEVNITGRDINLSARRSIDMTAHEGGILMRGRNWLQSVCERGTILLHGMAPKTPEGGDSEGDKRRLLSESGVLIRSDAADITLYSRFSDIRLDMDFLGSLYVKSRRILASTGQFFAKSSFGGSLFNFVPGAAQIRGLLDIDSLRSKTITTSTKVEDPTQKGFNHVFHVDPEDYAGAEDSMGDKDQDAPEELDEVELTGVDDVFKHRPSGEYDREALYENHTDRELRLNPGLVEMAGLDPDTHTKEDWGMGVGTPGAVEGAPYPGLNARQSRYESTDSDLNTPSAKNEFDNKAEPFKPQTITKPMIKQDG